MSEFPATARRIADREWNADRSCPTSGGLAGSWDHASGCSALPALRRGCVRSWHKVRRGRQTDKRTLDRLQSPVCIHQPLFRHTRNARSWKLTLHKYAPANSDNRPQPGPGLSSLPAWKQAAWKQAAWNRQLFHQKWRQALLRSRQQAWSKEIVGED